MALPRAWLWAGTLIGVLSFGLVAARLALGPVVPTIDIEAVTLAERSRSEAMTAIMAACTRLGDATVMVGLSLASAVLLALRGRRLQAVTTAASMGLGAVAVAGVKMLTERQRPPVSSALQAVPGSFSFPSGHSFSSMLLLTLLVVFVVVDFRQVWARALGVIVCGLIAVSVGMSRIYLGVHWLTDVLASWSLAWGWACATIAILARLRSELSGDEGGRGWAT